MKPLVLVSIVHSLIIKLTKRPEMKIAMATLLSVYIVSGQALAQAQSLDCKAVDRRDIDRAAMAIADKLEDKVFCEDGVEAIGPGEKTADVEEGISAFYSRCDLVNALLPKEIKTCDNLKFEIREWGQRRAIQAILPILTQKVFGDLKDATPEELTAMSAQIAKNEGGESSSVSYSNDIAKKDLPDAPSATKASAQSENGGSFWSNLIHAYLGKQTTAARTAGRPCRGNPAPLTSPPFPFTVWPYGGAPTIGCDSGSDTPVQNAIAATGNAKKAAQKRSGDKDDEAGFDHKRILFYGWLDASANISNSHSGGYANAPAAYQAIPNTIDLDQIAVYVERVPDTVQKDHFDYGFRATGLYGLDYRYTTAKGFLSNQLLKNNKKYGLDFPMLYVDLYFPKKAGLNVRIGRTISVPDIEAQLAPNNYMASHSLLYAVDAYTQTGVFITKKFNDHWLVQVGLSAGNDVMPWVKKDATPTGVACLGYTWGKGTKNVYVCDNSINSGKYKYNNMNQYNITFYDKLSKNWHTSNEFYFMKEREVPNVGGPIPTQPNSNGAYCPAGLNRCTTYETAYVNYMVREIAKGNPIFKDGGSLIFRDGYLYDKYGQRTGTPTVYSENVFGINWYFLKGRADFRPEAGVYHSWNNPAFDNGNHSTLKILAGDLIFNF